MRKIAFYGAISLDGFLATKEDSLQWLFDTEIAGVVTYDAFIQTVDTVIMGRTTFEETTRILGGAPLYPDKEKIVFSSTLTPQADITMVNEDVVTYLQKLRQQEGETIWIVGGGPLIQPLVAANMIDDYYIQIAPVLLGEGKRLFQEGDYQQQLTFVGQTQMGQLMELRYQKKEN